MVQARNDLQGMKDRNINDIDHIWLNKPKAYKIDSQFGIDSVYIDVPYGKEEVLIKRRIEKKEEEIITTFTYCLLVEMKAINKQWYDSPECFAVFVPGIGHESIDSGISSAKTVPNLEFFGYAFGMVENILFVHDPPGIVGQTTFRLKWCQDGALDPDAPYSKFIEQVKRVDQGFWAYDGDWDLEEVTACFSEDNFWTYEDIEYVNRWYSVDPGPPPEGTCGYSWAIWEEYSPDGDNGADYHDLRHLFFWVEAGDTITYHWPPEFNQYIVKEESYHVNSLVYRYIDYDTPLWDAVWAGASVQDALGDILMPNTLSKYTMLINDTIRAWGTIYGSVISAEEDIVREPAEFPYLEYDIREDRRAATATTNYIREFYEEGVYVKDRYKEMFIAGLVLWEPDDFYQNDYMWVNVREDKSDINFNYGLTDRQLEIIAGNVDADDIPEWYSAEEGRYYEDGISVASNGWIAINAGGDEFLVSDREVVSTYFYNHVLYEYKTIPVFEDYGIFAKKDTGIDENGIVAAETIDPIYAYACRVKAANNYGLSHLEYEGIIYGMVIDGLHYKTDILPLELTDAGWTNYGYYHQKNYLAIQGSTVSNSDNEPLYCKPEVRVGILETSEKRMKEITIDEQ